MVLTAALIQIPDQKELTTDKNAAKAIKELIKEYDDMIEQNKIPTWGKNKPIWLSSESFGEEKLIYAD